MSFFSLCCSVSIKHVADPIDISNASLMERLRSDSISQRDIQLEVSKTLKDITEAVDVKETEVLKEVAEVIEVVEESISDVAAAAAETAAVKSTE